MKTIISLIKPIKIGQLLLILGLQILLVFSTVNLPQDAFAETLNHEKAAQKTETAADTIVQDDQKDKVKQKFGQKEQGSELIDKAREHAQDKLQSLADETREKQNTGEPLPPDKELFLKKMQR